MNEKIWVRNQDNLYDKFKVRLCRLRVIEHFGSPECLWHRINVLQMNKTCNKINRIAYLLYFSCFD
jgi:hypothetical protein